MAGTIVSDTSRIAAVLPVVNQVASPPVAAGAVEPMRLRGTPGRPPRQVEVTPLHAADTAFSPVEVRPLRCSTEGRG